MGNMASTVGRKSAATAVYAVRSADVNVSSKSKSAKQCLTKKLFLLGLVLPVLGLVPWGYGVYYGFFAYRKPALQDDESVSNTNSSSISSMDDNEKLEQLAVRHGLPTEEEYFAYFCLGGILAETFLALVVTFLVLVHYGRVPGVMGGNHAYRG